MHTSNMPNNVRSSFLQSGHYHSVGALALAVGLLNSIPTAQAQDAARSGSALPPVTVDAPTTRAKSAAAPRTPTWTGRPRTASRRARAPATGNLAAVEAARAAPGGRRDSNGSVGFVATQGTSATKTNSPLVTTPQSISVITREQIDLVKANSIKEALLYSAGVNANSRAAFGGYDIVYSRGFVADRYLDGMKLQGNTGFITPQIDLYNASQVQLLRGPASVLYGQGSPGGIIDITSKLPTTTPFGEIELQGGTFDRFQGAFDVGTPLDKNKEFLFRLTGLVRDSGTQFDYTKEERQLIAPSLTWRPDNDTSLTILGRYQNDPHVGLYNLAPIVGTLKPNVNGQLPTNFYAGDPSFNVNRAEETSVGYLFEHRFNDWLQVKSRLRNMETEGTVNQVLPLSLTANQSTLTRYAQGDQERVNSLTADNLLQFDFATGPVLHTVITGVDYQNTTFDQRTTQAVTSSLNIFAPNYNQIIAVPTAVSSNILQSSQQTGIYAQDQLRLGGFTITASGRQDWADSSTLNRVTTKTTSQSDAAGTGRIGGSYLFNNGVAPYVAYATSFNPTAGATFAGTPYAPTTGELKEGGIKYQPGAFPALFTIAGYELVQQNALTIDPLHTGFNVQTGEITSRGLELEGKVRVFESLDLLAAYTYTDAKVTASNGPDIGKWPVYIPRNTASLLADYTFQHGPLTGFGGGGGVRYIGETYGDAANTYQVPGYTVFDAMLHYDLVGLDPSLKGFKLALNATNLFDKIYVSQCTNTNCLYGLRRTVLGSLKYQW